MAEVCSDLVLEAYLGFGSLDLEAPLVSKGVVKSRG